MKACDHPNIIKYYDAYKDKSKNLNIIMEHADGGDLNQLLKERKKTGVKFEEDEILDITVQILLALKYCHERDIVHRDIKPDNIFLT